jgi:hypothetical protein
MVKSNQWIPVAAVLIAAIGVLVAVNAQFHLVGANDDPVVKAAKPLPHDARKPILIPLPITTPDTEPEGSNSPTNVSLTNQRRIDALLQWVEFDPEKWVEAAGPYPTAHREVETIPIVFKMSGRPQSVGTQRYDLPVPMTVSGADEWSVLRVSFVWPEYAGKMLRGNLVAHFANATDLHVDNVVLNMLRQ